MMENQFLEITNNMCIKSNIFVLFAANASNKYRSTFFLIFDFCEHDLAGLLSNINVKFNLGEIKKVMQQLLNGLYYIHSNKVIIFTSSTVFGKLVLS